MFKSTSASFSTLRQYLDNVPVIETHEHYARYADAGDTLNFILNNYFMSDYSSAGDEEKPPIDLSPEERYKRFLTTYKKTDKTAYARCTLEGLRICWGIDSLDTFEDFLALEEKIKNRDAAFYADIMDKLHIKAKIADIYDLDGFVYKGDRSFSPYARFAFSLPPFHNLHNKEDIVKWQHYGKRPIKTLDDYTACFDAHLEKCVEFGIVCFKDQSAYWRSIDYSNPSKAEAESVFNDIMFNPRDIFGNDRVRPLDDWLFQYAMGKAAEYDLPVQLHTGHMAGIRNEITKTNASHLIPTLELHQDVRFDLFHGNWPYMDEYLFIGKNYPNAYLNLCWVQSIDPIYCVELMKRAVMTVPHSKIFAFGGDTEAVEWAAGYLSLARDSVACALSELIECGWLNMDEAKKLAADWFFNNPNEFYKLGFEHF